MLTKSNANIFEAHKKLVEESAKKIAKSNATVEKLLMMLRKCLPIKESLSLSLKLPLIRMLLRLTRIFEGFCQYLQKEKEAFSHLRFGLQ